jgi:BMFP domain-containing protein YqiC
MHPPGSRDPPPQPPTLSQVNNTLAALESQARRYSALMRQWDRSDAALAEIFAPFQYLTRTAIQELVNRARTLVRTIGGNFQLDPKGRREHEEHESLKRMLRTTRDDLTTVEDQLDELPQPSTTARHRLDRDRLDQDQLDDFLQPSRHRFYSHPSAPASYLSRSDLSERENPFHPSSEVLQLRGENSEYRDENLALGEENMALREELDEKEAIIRSLRDRVAFLEGEVEDMEGAKAKGSLDEDGDDDGDDDDEGGPIRGAKRRKL